MESVFRQSLEFSKSNLDEPPKTLDAVYMIFSAHKFILSVVNAEVSVADINQPVVSTPTVGINHRFWCDLTANNALQRVF